MASGWKGRKENSMHWKFKMLNAFICDSLGRVYLRWVTFGGTLHWGRGVTKVVLLSNFDGMHQLSDLFSEGDTASSPRAGFKDGLKITSRSAPGAAVCL